MNTTEAPTTEAPTVEAPTIEAPVAPSPDEGEAGQSPGAAIAYRLTGVSRAYRTATGVITPINGLHLEIRAGEFVTIQGPTGGGKSTLLQLLGALDRPTKGTVLLGDGSEAIDLAGASNAELTRIRAQRIGFVFQSFNLIPTLTAHENVDTALEGRRIPHGERTERVRRALERVGLGDRGSHRPSELSGGQQQRVAIARAIVAEPEVLLADEPTGNLDEAMRDEILALLEELNAEGLTIVAVTHDSAVAARAHRRLLLARGVIGAVAAGGAA